MTPLDEHNTNTSGEVSIKQYIADAMKEMLSEREGMNEPAARAELEVERKKRELLEQRLNSVIEENNRNKALADAMEKETRVKHELQRLGVQKLDLAFKVIKDDIHRGPEGAIQAKTREGNLPLAEYLKSFLDENPELLPARNLGGSGSIPAKQQGVTNGVDLDSIRPGMSQEEMARVRREIARVAGILND